ncbi:hypothetical protein AWB71_04306 [Caballeronia peredens]|nr:hypothetical protein AWB71_04306 [Caballeronia peredens]
MTDPGHDHGPGGSAIGFLGNGTGGGNTTAGSNIGGFASTAVSATGLSVKGSGTGVGIVGNGTGISIQPNGGAETRGKNLAVNYLIKY